MDAKVDRTYTNHRVWLFDVGPLIATGTYEEALKLLSVIRSIPGFEDSGIICGSDTTDRPTQPCVGMTKRLGRATKRP